MSPVSCLTHILPPPFDPLPHVGGTASLGAEAADNLAVTANSSGVATEALA
jgi:hypothetical protein